MGHQGLGWEGEGFTEDELGAVRGWLSGKAMSIYGGSFEIQNNIIAKKHPRPAREHAAGAEPPGLTRKEREEERDGSAHRRGRLCSRSRRRPGRPRRRPVARFREMRDSGNEAGFDKATLGEHRRDGLGGHRRPRAVRRGSTWAFLTFGVVLEELGQPADGVAPAGLGARGRDRAGARRQRRAEGDVAAEGRRGQRHRDARRRRGVRATDPAQTALAAEKKDGAFRLTRPEDPRARGDRGGRVRRGRADRRRAGRRRRHQPLPRRGGRERARPPAALDGGQPRVRDAHVRGRRGAGDGPDGRARWRRARCSRPRSIAVARASAPRCSASRASRST